MIFLKCFIKHCITVYPEPKGFTKYIQDFSKYHVVFGTKMSDNLEIFHKHIQGCAMAIQQVGPMNKVNSYTNLSSMNNLNKCPTLLLNWHIVL